MNFVDDDDLQDMLSRARKVAQKGAKKQKEEEEDELPAVLLQTEQQGVTSSLLTLAAEKTRAWILTPRMAGW